MWEDQRRYRAKNKDKINRKRREWRAANKDVVKEENRKQYERIKADPDLWKKRQGNSSDYYQENKDKIRERQREYERQPEVREKRKEYARKRNARKAAEKKAAKEAATNGQVPKPGGQGGGPGAGHSTRPEGPSHQGKKWNALVLFLIQCLRCGYATMAARDSGAAYCESCGCPYEMASLPSRYETGMDPDERYAAEHDAEELVERLMREMRG